MPPDGVTLQRLCQADVVHELSRRPPQREKSMNSRKKPAELRRLGCIDLLARATAGYSTRSAACAEAPVLLPGGRTLRLHFRESVGMRNNDAR